MSNIQDGSLVYIHPLKSGDNIDKFSLFYKAFRLEFSKEKNYSYDYNVYLCLDRLYVVTKSKITINVRNRIYFNHVQLLDAEDGTIAYVDKNHLSTLEEDNESFVQCKNIYKQVN